MCAPLEIVTCEVCGGYGNAQERITVYEHGCGFPHDDVHEYPCPHCLGLGEFVREAEGRLITSTQETKS